MKKLGFIGGSGLYNIEGGKKLTEHRVDTPYGLPSDEIVEVEFDDKTVFFLPRHGKNHTFLPHEINYRANIYALKKLGVEVLISVSAVGSLTDDCPPGSFFIPDQFIDWTKGKRERTFFGKGIVCHVSAAKPVDSNLLEVIQVESQSLGIQTSSKGSYICIEGPQFSTKAESKIYRDFGAKVIGMTNVPEAYLAKEAGISYATIAMVTDFDCWKEEHCSVEEIMKVMKENNSKAQKLIPQLIKKIDVESWEVIKENSIGMLSKIDTLSEEKQNILKVLMR